MEEIVQPVEAIEPVPTPEPELPELSYEYQPTDDQGRLLGGKQVIKYKTNDELVGKLKDQNVHLVRALREQTKKARLGIADDDVVPADAPRFDVPLEFNPRTLSPDERVQLSRDLLDPERFEEATSTLFESTLGVKPQALRDSLTRMSQNELSILAKVESDAFINNNPEYYGCRENFDTITTWMVKNDLMPVRQNFQLAYDTLKRQGIIMGRPEERMPEPEPVSITTHVEPVVEPEPVIVKPEPVVPKNVPPPTGLRDNSSVTPPVAPRKYTLNDINRMSADEYKHKLLHERGFPQIVEELNEEAKKRR